MSFFEIIQYYFKSIIYNLLFLWRDSNKTYSNWSFEEFISHNSIIPAKYLATIFLSTAYATLKQQVLSEDTAVHLVLIMTTIVKLLYCTFSPTIMI